MTKLKSGLSKGQGDGLSAVARLALRSPRRRQMAIVICDCSQITVDTETQAKEATIRVIRLEKIAPDDVKFGKDYRIDPVTGEIIVPGLEPRMPGDGVPDLQDDAGAVSADVADEVSAETEDES